MTTYRYEVWQHTLNPDTWKCIGIFESEDAAYKLALRNPGCIVETWDVGTNTFVEGT